MLDSRRCRSTTRVRAVLVTLAGLLMAHLIGCAALDSSPSEPTTDRGTAIVERVYEAGVPIEVSAPAESPIPSIHRRLTDLLGRTSDPRGERVGNDDGFIPDGASVSPFEVDHPAIARLDPTLLDAIQRAALDARHNGIEVRISSGWRSAAYQQTLLDDAVRRYGSEEEARRFVNTPEQSTHVTGRAADVAPMDAMSWLSQYGAAYGLCQTYANELWHYELMTEPGGTCPSPLADASAG